MYSYGGRPETLVAIQAIRDRPIVGHGSFAADFHYLELEQQLQYEYGYTDTDIAEDVDYYPVIPTHSHLTMAWVESGILGGLLWIYILVLTLRALFQVAVTRPNMAPLYSYLLVNFVWDILYSPFGSVNRMVGAYLVLLGYHMLRMPVKGTTGSRPTQTGCQAYCLPSVILSLDWSMAYGVSNVLRSGPIRFVPGITDIEAHAIADT